MLEDMGFPGGSEVKASACKVGGLGSIPGWEDPLEKEMATHSSTLAWRIPWTEELGRLQSTGSQSWTRLSDFTFTFRECSHQIYIFLFYVLTVSSSFGLSFLYFVDVSIIMSLFLPSIVQIKPEILPAGLMCSFLNV